MKKHLAIISFVLISLLAIGVVSASDSSNLTDDSAMLMTGVGDNEQADLSQSDGFKDNLILSGESDDGSSVNVNNVTVKEGETVVIPFDVENSNGTPACGVVNVSITGENKTVSRYIELNNIAGQSNMTVTDLIGLIGANGGNVSGIYDIIISSSNFTNMNISKIISGVNNLKDGVTVNFSNLEDGAEKVINGTDVNEEKLIEGLNIIINGTKVNISEFIKGFDEVRSAIVINASGYSVLGDVFNAVLGGFSFDSAKLRNNVLDSVIITKASFVNGLNSLLNALGDDGSQDFLSRLNLKLSLAIQLKVVALMLKKEFTLLEVSNLADEILSYNKLTKKDFLDRLIGVCEDFTFSVSDIVGKKDNPAISSALDKIVGSVRIDSNKILNSIADAVESATFNKAKVALDLSDITGIDRIKLLEFLDGADDIYHAVEFDRSNVIEAIEEILAGFGSTDASALKDMLGTVSFNADAFSEDLEMILAGFNYTRSDISKEVYSLIDHYNLTVPHELDVRLSDSLNAEKLNFTELGNVFFEIMLQNKMTSFTLRDLLSSSSLDISKIIQGFADHTFNVSNALKSVSIIMSYVNVDYDKILTSFAEIINSNSRNSFVGNGLVKMFSAAKLNVSMAMAGINKIAKIDYNKSKVIEILDGVKNSVDISKLLGGLDKIISSISVSESGFYNGLAKIISAFSFNRATVYGGLHEITHAIGFNNSLIERGIYNVAEGLGINVSCFTSKFFAKFGYVATFRDDFACGTYNVTVRYGNVTDDSAKLTVLSKSSTPIRLDAKVVENHVYITGSLNSDAKGLVLFEIGDLDVYNLVVGGKIAFDDIFKPGTYNINAKYLGDSKFNKNSTALSFIVKSPTTITAPNVSTTYANGKSMVITLKDSEGKAVSGRKVTVKLNGKTYTQTTDSNGKISVSVPGNLKPTTYTASVAFAGDSKYVKSSASAKVTVSKATPKITANAKTFKAAVKTKKYTVTLKNNKNGAMKSTQVTIKVNGKTFSAKTNSKGQATFKITGLNKKGTFKATVTYKGNAYYKKVTKNVNVKIK